RAQVGHDVAVEVRQHQDVVQLGLLHELHTHVVHDPVVELDVGVLGRHLPRHVEPEAVGVLHDVGLVHRGHLAAAVGARVVERELHHPAGARLGDRLDRDAGALADLRAGHALDRLGDLALALRPALELDARVEILGVLAHDHEVDAGVGVAGADARVVLARAHLRVQVERLAQADVDRAESAADRGRDRALDGGAVAADRLDDVAGERVAAVAIHDVGAGVLHVPVEACPGGLQNPPRRICDLGAGTVAGNECDTMTHAGFVLPDVSRKRTAHPAGGGGVGRAASGVGFGAWLTRADSRVWWSLAAVFAPSTASTAS